MYSGLRPIFGNIVICSDNVLLSAASCIYFPSKKCADNLEMCEICVNTHIATGVSSRVNILIIINTCKGGNSFLRELSALFPYSYPPFYPLQVLKQHQTIIIIT